MLFFTDLDLPGLEDLLRQWGQKPGHGRELFRHFYGNHGSFNWPAGDGFRTLRHLIEERIQLRQSTVLRRHPSGDGTVKLLVGFARGGSAECVLMPAYRSDRAAACISSQIGCAMGCDFCASTKAGLERSLTAGEMTEQYLHLKRQAADLGRKLTSLVFMGMGEPLLNLAELLPGIRRIADPHMGGLGWRQITVSTVGIVPGIDALAEADLNVHLAVSLHAPDDATRARIVPMNRRWGVGDILEAVRRFYHKTHRVPTIEYCLLADVNDRQDQAQLLAERLRGLKAHVNLIPYNPIGAGLSGRIYQRPSEVQTMRFLQVLRAHGAVAHLRQARGDDVTAACGQLRARSREDA